MSARALVGSFVVCVAVAVAQASDREHPVFRMDRVWRIHLDIPAEEWEAIQPVGQTSGFFGPVVRANPEPANRPVRLDRHSSAFGLEFPWGTGTFTTEGVSYRVGIRFKGNSAYSAAGRGPKRPFKIDFDRVDPNGHFHGLKALNLNNNAIDSTQLREALAYAVFRAARVPASRTAFAEVTLTVPGRYDREYLGLYTLIEEVDKVFLKERFGKGQGLLLKPEVRIRELTRREPIAGIDDLGDEWPRYAAHYNPKNNPTAAQRERLMAFAQLVGSANDSEFAGKIDEFLDIDGFLRYLAVNAFLVNLDSYFALGHNYYIYLNPQTNRFTFIPWDLNLAFAGIVMGGSVDQLLDLSMVHPHWDENKLIDRLLAIPERRAAYLAIVRELIHEAVPQQRLEQWITDLRKETDGIREREKAAAAKRKDSSVFPMLTFAPTLEKFIEKRYASVTTQLNGQTSGYVPKNLMRPELLLSGRTNWAKSIRENLDSDGDSRLSEVEFVNGVERLMRERRPPDPRGWSEAAIAQIINELLAPPGQRPPAGPLSPGTILAGAIVRQADANFDGIVSEQELLATARMFYTVADASGERKLTDGQISDGILSFVTKPRFRSANVRSGNPK